MALSHHFRRWFLFAFLFFSGEIALILNIAAFRASLIKNGETPVLAATLNHDEVMHIPAGTNGLFTCPSSNPPTGIVWSTPQDISGSSVHIYEYSDGFFAEKNRNATQEVRWPGFRFRTEVAVVPLLEQFHSGKTYFVKATTNIDVTCSHAVTPVSCAPPSDAVHIPVGSSIQTIVDAEPPGTSFLLGKGVHRMQTIRPKSGDAFYGERGPNCERLTILNGSRILTDATRNGNSFVVTGQTQEGYSPTDNDGFQKCETGFDRCRHPEDLFFNNVPLTHVEQISDVHAGTWFFDYPNDTITFADDPAEKTVEASVTDYAFDETLIANNVMIKGLIIEKYATPLEEGVIHNTQEGTNWTVEDNEIRLNHGIGIQLFTDGKAVGNSVHDQGQYGLNAHGSNVLFEDNEVSHNNIAHVNSGWGAGGSKFVQTTGLTVRNNCVHDNKGPGLWTDIDNVGTLYEGNTVFGNRNEGIFHEISSGAIIRNNRVGQNGEQTQWLFGTQILLSNSTNGDVYGNTVEVNPDFGNAIGIIWVPRSYNGKTYDGGSNTVHGNDITFLGSTSSNGNMQGAAASPDEPRVFSQNHFFGNHYHAPNTSFPHFAWLNAPRTFTFFRQAGQDMDGTMDTNVQASNWRCGGNE